MASVMEFRLEGEDVIWQGLHKRVPGDTRIDPLYAKGSKLVVHVERGSGGRTKAEVMDHNGRQIGEFAVPTTACAAAFAPGSENRLAIHGERNTCLVDLNLRDEARSRDCRPVGETTGNTRAAKCWGSPRPLLYWSWTCLPTETRHPPHVRTCG